jgi:hypothetical protein
MTNPYMVNSISWGGDEAVSASLWHELGLGQLYCWLIASMLTIRLCVAAVTFVGYLS